MLQQINKHLNDANSKNKKMFELMDTDKNGE